MVAPANLRDIFGNIYTKNDIRYYGITQSNDRMDEMKQVWKACSNLQPDKLVYTTFVLEGYSIAEKLCISSVVVSLFPLQLYPIPEDFETQVKSAYPELYKTNISPHWPHVKHWMWRLYLDDQGDFRESILDLDPIPVIRDPPTLIYALDPYLFHDFPHEISQAAGFWPLFSYSGSTTLSLSIAVPILLIHFGSMDTLSMTLMEPETFIRQISTRINEILCNFETLHIVWMATPDTSLYKQLLQKFNHDRVHIIPPEEHAYFNLNFKVIGVIHHGGISTCCSFIRYGVHQAILPFMFDQFYWAEVLASINISKTLNLETSWVDIVSWMYNKDDHALMKAVQETLEHNTQVGFQLALSKIAIDDNTTE